MMKGGSAIKGVWDELPALYEPRLMNNINSLTVFGSTLDCRERGGRWPDDATLIFGRAISGNK